MPDTPFFHTLDRVDSTNNYAMEMVHAGLAVHGMAWFALDQWQGKGQRGKNWESEPGMNIALSVVLEPGSLKGDQQFYLSASAALASREFFSGFAGEEVKIKWPNDLYWRDRKAGGILVENIFRGKNWHYAIIGIGININQVKFDPGLENPVSLKQITGKDFDPSALAASLHSLLLERFSMIHENAFEKIREEYNHHLFAKGQMVKLKKEGVVFETRVKEVDQKGKLVTHDLMERHFNFGEVEWLL